MTIKAHTSIYHVTAVGIVNDKALSVEYDTGIRDAKLHRKVTAEKWGCKPANVAVSITTRRVTYTIDADASNFEEALKNAGFTYTTD